MFAAFFGNYFRIYDNFNKKYRWINVAGDMAGIRCEITTTNASWWVSAGLKRGIIRGIDRMGFTPSEPMRDNLYKNSINPLVTFPGTGHLVWGNKTLQAYASAFDRINVRSMFNTIERSMSKSAKSQVFEFNDPFTRNAMLSMFNPYLAAVKAGRGIIDFLVICDETNNNPDVLKTPHELRVDIYIKPNYSAEFIQLNFVNVGTRSFVEVIGA
jgi:phage tail sheath protein FI